MATWGRMALICTAALAVASASAHVSAQTTLKDRVVSAIESVEAACADDINKFCGHVTRGEGRLLLCMQAHDDQLSFRCQFGLYRASRHLDNALNRVERIADACWGDIETQCKDAQSIGQCVLDKAPALSQACQTVVAQRLGTDQTTAVCKRLAYLGVPFILYTRYDATDARRKWPSARVIPKPASATDLIMAVADLLN